MRRIPLSFPVAVLAATLAVLTVANAQKYSGPTPPQPDVPYLKHATNLIATEVAQAKPEKKGDGTLYTIPGASSTARTPLALPVFLIKTDKIVPERLVLYKLESVEGHRQLLLAPGEQGAMPFHMEVARLSSDPAIYKIEVGDGLESGEYVLRREGSDQVFCFQVF